MQDELIKLLERVKAKTGWKDSYLSERFGNRRAAERLRRNSIQLRTAERFKEWLQSQLDETPS